MISGARTVDEYLNELPPERRADIEAVRNLVLANLPPGYEEGMDYGMISWFVPLSRKADTYNGHPLAIASLALQKNYGALYLMGVYGHPGMKSWFVDAYKKSGKSLDMGKSCVRFEKADDLALDVIGEVIKRVSVDDYIKLYDASRGAPKKKKKTSAQKKKKKKKKSAPKKSATKKKSAKKKTTSTKRKKAR